MVQVVLVMLLGIPVPDCVLLLLVGSLQVQVVPAVPLGVLCVLVVVVGGIVDTTMSGVTNVTVVFRLIEKWPLFASCPCLGDWV